jgi:tetratricopeptide (TPR) repeat protein
MKAYNILQSQEEAQFGVAALQQGRKDTAGLHFLQALQYLDTVSDLSERRNLLSEISELFSKTGFEDLALMAVLDALDADKRLGLQQGLSKDYLTYANIHYRLGNLGQAEVIYRSLVDQCLKNSDYANAASASTNLAGILAHDNYLAEASHLLEKSLDYLKNVNFRNTEFNTRIMLIQILELRKTDPARIFEATRALLDRFTDNLTPQDISVLSQIVESAFKRFVQIHTDIDENDWKMQRFPELYNA